MKLGDAPCWGAFTFEYKTIKIYVPGFLNNVARYKPDSFWDWLLESYATRFIHLTYEDIKHP